MDGFGRRRIRGWRAAGYPQRPPGRGDCSADDVRYSEQRIFIGATIWRLKCLQRAAIHRVL
jgi:hypothetical protein